MHHPKAITSALFVLLTVVFVFCGTASAAPQSNSSTYADSSRMLIAYFSLSGNTRLIARDIQRMTGGELFEIRPVRRYGPDSTPPWSRPDRNSGNRRGRS